MARIQLLPAGHKVWDSFVVCLPAHTGSKTERLPMTFDCNVFPNFSTLLGQCAVTKLRANWDLVTFFMSLLTLCNIFDNNLWACWPLPCASLWNVSSHSNDISSLQHRSHLCKKVFSPGIWKHCAKNEFHSSRFSSGMHFYTCLVRCGPCDNLLFLRWTILFLLQGFKTKAAQRETKKPGLWMQDKTKYTEWDAIFSAHQI